MPFFTERHTQHMTTEFTSPLTLMAVHAHPDDESTSTGGTPAHYALRGVRTVVVTCTDGQLGDGPGVKPGADGHDPREVANVRQGELRRACAHLGVSHLELLGYGEIVLQGPWQQLLRLLNRALAEIGIHRPSPSAERQEILDAVEQRITTIIKRPTTV
jgi:LmbE family N-acetylglucosaminyl deacetylase